MKSDGEIMEILAAYDLTASPRATAELTGCSHRTVARHVAARDAGWPIAEPAARPGATDAFLPKIEEWVEASKGRIRADVAREKLQWPLSAAKSANSGAKDGVCRGISA